ncbi:MAG: DUF2399 domain-containing protein [Methylococcaceae bacterium]|nr:MAG: DUF2399 domain-containing protein [Methylococcaceae bacterium]
MELGNERNELARPALFLNLPLPAAVTALWDAALTQAMLQQRLAIDEEAVAGPLLADMAAA